MAATVHSRVVLIMPVSPADIPRLKIATAGARVARGTSRSRLSMTIRTTVGGIPSVDWGKSSGAGAMKNGMVTAPSTWVSSCMWPLARNLTVTGGNISGNTRGGQEDGAKQLWGISTAVHGNRPEIPDDRLAGCKVGRCHQQQPTPGRFSSNGLYHG